MDCQDKPHLWVHPDGSYQEEGMNNIKGKIWDKVCLSVDVLENV